MTLRLEITEATCVLVRELTCPAFSEVMLDRAPNWVVDSEEMSLVAIAAVWAVPRVASCVVLKPETCAEVIEPTCAAVSAATPLVLMEPIWVVLRALRTLVDSAATSTLLSPFSVVVDRAEACEVVRAPS